MVVNPENSTSLINQQQHAAINRTFQVFSEKATSSEDRNWALLDSNSGIQNYLISFAIGADIALAAAVVVIIATALFYLCWQIKANDAGL